MKMLLREALVLQDHGINWAKGLSQFLQNGLFCGAVLDVFGAEIQSESLWVRIIFRVALGAAGFGAKQKLPLYAL
ncbi:MAG: hypothetical protein QUT30_16320 [Acidobacteriota bacterium]|nr:hypothetical protein [Acidobacteriota bacterium]